jgi:hypothetical protein
MRIFFGIIIGLVLAIAIAFAAAKHAFGDLSDIGDRDRSEDVTQTLDLEGFDGIEVAGVFDIDVTVGGDYSVVVSGAQDQMERLDATVEDGVLKLDQEEAKFGKRFWRDQGMSVTISLPSLNSFELAGVADGDVTGIDAETFEIDLAGVGDLVLTGRCGRLDAQVSGVGDLDAKALECRDVDIDVSGVGSATVYASESAEATVGGIGSIEIYGSPSKVDKNSSFIASISVK